MGGRNGTLGQPLSHAHKKKGWSLITPSDEQPHGIALERPTTDQQPEKDSLRITISSNPAKGNNDYSLMTKLSITGSRVTTIWARPVIDGMDKQMDVISSEENDVGQARSLYPPNKASRPEPGYPEFPFSCLSKVKQCAQSPPSLGAKGNGNTN
ncbi:hypothetical protein CPB86DRAFT_796867 [Serendipita vermifera]|nr:hypothetical protein CPB86DRAFT_796867 [Serendipita vermifera]